MNMKNHCVKLIIASLTLIFATQNTLGQMAVIDEIFQKAKEKSFSTDKKAQRFVTDHFDFDAMAKLILGSEAKKQPKSEVKWFSNQIEQILSKTIYNKSTDFLNKVRFEHEYVEEGKKKSTILTIVKKRGEESEVMTKFENNNGVWKIVDLSIDDESWSENIRSQVHKSIKEKGWKGLKESLTKRLNELEKN